MIYMDYVNFYLMGCKIVIITFVTSVKYLSLIIFIIKMDYMFNMQFKAIRAIMNN